jgi:hypothetical protein
MPFLNQSENPFQYMEEFNALWYILIGALVVCALLVVILRPLHKYYTDKKTRDIIKESGAADELEAQAGGDDEEGDEE